MSNTLLSEIRFSDIGKQRDDCEIVVEQICDSCMELKENRCEKLNIGIIDPEHSCCARIIPK